MKKTTTKKAVKKSYTFIVEGKIYRSREKAAKAMVQDEAVPSKTFIVTSAKPYNKWPKSIKKEIAKSANNYKKKTGQN